MDQETNLAKLQARLARIQDEIYPGQNDGTEGKSFYMSLTRYYQTRIKRLTTAAKEIKRPTTTNIEFEGSQETDVMNESVLGNPSRRQTFLRNPHWKVESILTNKNANTTIISSSSSSLPRHDVAPSSPPSLHHSDREA